MTTTPSQVRIRNNGTIHEIKIPSEQWKELQKILNSSVSDVVKEATMKKYSVGRCCVCGNVATQMVTYDISDEIMAAKRVERYCDNCIKSVYTKGLV